MESTFDTWLAGVGALVALLVVAAGLTFQNTRRLNEDASWVAYTIPFKVEDESRIRDANARDNFAWLRRFTLSLLKQHSKKDSIAMKRRSCGWDDHFLIEVLTGQAI